MPKRPFYGIFNETEWPQVERFADKEHINVSELVRRAIRFYAKSRGVRLPIDTRKDYFSRTRRGDRRA